MYLYRVINNAIRDRAGVVKNDQRGIGLLEAMVALLVLMVGIVAGLVLMLSSTFAARISRDQLIASNLAREGVELVRNVRDSNWLKIEAGELNGTVPYQWDDGLYGPASIYTAYPSYDATTKWTLNYTDAADTAPVWNVYLDSTGYGGQGGLYNQFPVVVPSPTLVITKYTRKITTLPICYDGTSETVPGGDCGAGTVKIGIQVKVDVKWLDNNTTRTISLEDRLYNWK